MSGAIDSMMFASLPVGVDVNHHAPEVGEVMKQLVSDFTCNIVALRDGQPTRHRNADVRGQTVTDPARDGHGGRSLERIDIPLMPSPAEFTQSSLIRC